MYGRLSHKFKRRGFAIGLHVWCRPPSSWRLSRAWQAEVRSDLPAKPAESHVRLDFSLLDTAGISHSLRSDLAKMHWFVCFCRLNVRLPTDTFPN